MPASGMFNTPLSARSVLVRYDPQHVSTEEIVIRIATGLSLEHDNAGIRVLTRPPTRELTDSAFYSGVAAACRAGFAPHGAVYGCQCCPGPDCRPHHGGGCSASRVGGLSPAWEFRPGSAQRDLFADCAASAAMRCRRRSSRGSAPSGGIWFDCRLRESRSVPLRLAATALRHVRGCGRPRPDTAG